MSHTADICFSVADNRRFLQLFDILKKAPYMAIEGITSPDGRVLGKMAHAERKGRSVAMNIYGEQDMKLFESGVKYFK